MSFCCDVLAVVATVCQPVSVQGVVVEKQLGSIDRYDDDDEIDLRELFSSLWAERAVIVLVTLLVAGIAAAYAFLVSPVYEAKSSLLPPQQSDIAAYNLGRKAAGLPEFGVAEVYGIFTRNLRSEMASRSFFRDVYLPSLGDSERSLPQDKLWERFRGQLSVKAPDAKQRPEYFEVRIEQENPELAAKWVSLFVQRVADITLSDMQQNVRQQIDTRARELEQQIAVLREAAFKRRQDRMVRLKEALVTAELVGVASPQVVPGRTASDGDLAAFMDGSLMYMRGAKAIRSELKLLETRESDDPFIGELRALQSDQAFLQRINVQPDNVAVFTLDAAAETPDTPIKPKRMLILAVGMLLGGMLGVLVALVRVSCRKKEV